MNTMIRTFSSTWLFCLFVIPYPVFSQSGPPEILGLKECVKRTIENNTSIKTSLLDEQKMHWKIIETRGNALPQVSISGTYDDYLKLPTSLIPGEFFGQPGTMIPVQFGTKYNMSGGISATQLLYSQTFNASLVLAKQMKELSALSTEKVKYEVVANVTKLYFMIQSTEAQKRMVERNITHFEKLSGLSKTQKDSGLIRGIDVDRVNVSLMNLQTALQTVNTLYVQEINSLKYLMGMNVSASINLADSSDLFSIAQAAEPLNEKHIDLLMIQKQQRVEEQTLQVTKSQRYPTLSAYGRYNSQSMDDKFRFFESGSNWYKTSVFGLSLNIPVFTGFQNVAKVKQSRITIEALALKEADTKRNLDMETVNAANKYADSQKSCELQKYNVELAQRVFSRTNELYKSGIAPLSDLLQSESALQEAESNLIQAELQIKIAKVELLKANGNLLNILK